MAIPPFNDLRLLPGEENDPRRLRELFEGMTRNFEDLYNRYATGTELTERAGKSTQWFSVPFTANWKNYEAGFAKCQYRKGSDGRVYLRGLAQPTAIGTNNVFTLPTGFRSSLAGGFACAAGNGGGAVVLCRVDVRANGEVIPTLNFTGTTGEFYLFLDTISFYPG
jgi:hypothetical protein